MSRATLVSSRAHGTARPRTPSRIWDQTPHSHSSNHARMMRSRLGHWLSQSAQTIGGPRAPMHATTRRARIVDASPTSPITCVRKTTRAPSGSENTATVGSDSSCSSPLNSELSSLNSEFTGLPSGTDPKVARAAVSPRATVGVGPRSGSTPRVPVQTSTNASSAAKNAATPALRPLDWIELRTSNDRRHYATRKGLGQYEILLGRNRPRRELLGRNRPRPRREFAALNRDARAAAPNPGSMSRVSPPTHRYARARPSRFGLRACAGCRRARFRPRTR